MASRTLPAIACINWKPFEKNTLRGFFDLILTDYGITIKGCTLHSRSHIQWVGYPGRPYEKDGKTAWANVVDISDRDMAADMQSHILAALEKAIASAPAEA